MARKRLGELLLDRKAITAAQLSTALAHQRQHGGRLGNALVAKGYLTETALCQVLGEALGLPVVESVGLRDWTALPLLRAGFCERHELFPIALDEGHGARRQLTVAMADPLDLAAIEQIEFTTGCKVKSALAPRTEIREAILRYYYRQAPGGIAPTADTTGRMTLVRPGGTEETIDTRAAAKTAPPPLPRQAPPEPEEIVPLTEEVTTRTELSELIRARESAGRTRQKSKGQMADDLDFLLGTEDSQAAQIQELDRRFWALMRLMARKGLISKEEFLEEFDE